MIQWIRDWWNNNGHKHELKKVESDLRVAVEEHKTQSHIARDQSERDEKYTNGLIKAAEDTLAMIKRGEQG